MTTTVELEENVTRAVIEQMAAGSEASLHSDIEPEPAEEPASPYEFDEEFQKRIAALSVVDSGFMRQTEGLIQPEYFENESRAILVSIAQDYYNLYRALPSGKAVWQQLLKDAIDSKRIRKDMVSGVVGELKDLLRSNIADRDYVVDKVAEFARNQAVQRAMMRALDLMEKGRMDDAQKLMEKSFRVGAAEDFKDSDFWGDIDRRTQYRKDKLAGLIKPNGIPTGIKEIDKILYHGGWGRQELSAIMGGAKRGKSMALGEFCVRASLQGFNCIYISLEVAADIIMDRMDANISGTVMNDLGTHLNTVHNEIKLRAGRAVGAIKVCQFASGSLTPSAIRRILERYRADGVKFDIIVVDYADIMAPDIRSENDIENSRQIWLGLRAIAFEENAAVLTATQTNRDGFKASTAKAEHAADDFNKIRIADLVISINRDEAERASGKARLYFAASRNQEGDFALQIEQDLARMKFIKKVLGATT